jgi:hypothetical protein
VPAGIPLGDRKGSLIGASTDHPGAPSLGGSAAPAL